MRTRPSLVSPNGSRMEHLASVQSREPDPMNVLNGPWPKMMQAVKNANDLERRAIALAWLFHLVGDIHQPLHTAQLFTVTIHKATGAGRNMCAGDASRATNGPPHVLGRG